MDTTFITAFTEKTITTFEKMADVKLITDGEVCKDNNDITSLGVTSIISFAGKGKGRLILDMETNLALQIGKNIIAEDFNSVKDEMLLATIGELNNTIAGAAITDINNAFSMSLRLSPPIEFTGRDVVIAIPKINSVSNTYRTEYGKLKINIAFEGGSFDGC